LQRLIQTLPNAATELPYEAPASNFSEEEPFYFHAKNLPAWATINASNGQISGIPAITDKGISIFTLYLTKGAITAANIDIGEATQVAFQSIRLGMLTHVDIKSGHYTLNNPILAATDYFQTIPTSRLIMGSYADMQLDKVIVRSGVIYDDASPTTGSYYAGDMRVDLAKSQVSVGINLANFGITSNNMNQSYPHLFKQTTIHHAWGNYENGRIPYGRDAMSGGSSNTGFSVYTHHTAYSARFIQNHLERYPLPTTEFASGYKKWNEERGQYEEFNYPESEKRLMAVELTQLNEIFESQAGAKLVDLTSSEQAQLDSYTSTEVQSIFSATAYSEYQKYMSIRTTLDQLKLLLATMTIEGMSDSEQAVKVKELLSNNKFLATSIDLPRAGKFIQGPKYFGALDSSNNNLITPANTEEEASTLIAPTER
jgi:hypothetical protein